eukprot:CAMPEP_0178417878 /NCGR_PEP_ID=MMETSP0689_2-20121128/24798_1 /TAXON_ID=160604 /ORGANISM="Amphidinium massartii, Strain CS-259" /LENGTH=457 /DNA_ID=CAMNT_0020039251 /DNA_START=1 /DNA_END=1374 /DNA_ORIENTATION=-
MAGRILALACLASGVVAERYNFDHKPAPEGYSLDGWYMFRVYNQGDFAEASGTATFQVQKPKIEMHVVAMPKGGSEPPSSGSLEVAVMHHDDFSTSFDEENFCKDGKLKPTSDKAEFFSTVIPFDADGFEVSAPLNKTGKYILMLSNCGSFDKATISGFAQVKNPFGYLPPEMYHQVTPLCAFLFGYVVLTGGWIAYGVSQKKQFYDIHSYLTALLGLAVLEVMASLYALNTANTTAVMEPYMSIATILYVLKWVYVYALAAYVVSGYYDNDDEATNEDLHNSSTKSWLIGMGLASIYTVVLSLRECVMAERAGGNISSGSVLAINFPVMVLDAVLILYVLLQSKHQYDDAEAKINISRSGIFSKLHKLAAVCAILGGMSLVLSAADILGLASLSWSSQWMAQQGASHVICLVALGGAIFIMRPGMVEKKNLYGKVGVVGDAEGGETVGRPDDDDEM